MSRPNRLVTVSVHVSLQSHTGRLLLLLIGRSQRLSTIQPLIATMKENT